MNVFSEWSRRIAIAPVEMRFGIFAEAAHDIALHVGEELDKVEAADKLLEVATTHAFFGRTEQELEAIVADEMARAELERRDGRDIERRWEEDDAKRANGKARNEPVEAGRCLDEWDAGNDPGPIAAAMAAGKPVLPRLHVISRCRRWHRQDRAADAAVGFTRARPLAVRPARVSPLPRFARQP